MPSLLLPQHPRQRSFIETLPTLAAVSLFVSGVNQASGQSTAILSLDAPADGTVVGYRVYQGTNSGSYTSVITVGDFTQASFGGLTSGTLCVSWVGSKRLLPMAEACQSRRPDRCRQYWQQKSIWLGSNRAQRKRVQDFRIR